MAASSQPSNKEQLYFLSPPISSIQDQFIKEQEKDQPFLLTPADLASPIENSLDSVFQSNHFPCSSSTSSPRRNPKAGKSKCKLLERITSAGSKTSSTLLPSPLKYPSAVGSSDSDSGLGSDERNQPDHYRAQHLSNQISKSWTAEDSSKNINRLSDLCDLDKILMKNLEEEMAAWLKATTTATPGPMSVESLAKSKEDINGSLIILADDIKTLDEIEAEMIHPTKSLKKKRRASGKKKSCSKIAAAYVGDTINSSKEVSHPKQPTSEFLKSIVPTFDRPKSESPTEIQINLGSPILFLNDPYPNKSVKPVNLGQSNDDSNKPETIDKPLLSVLLKPLSPSPYQIESPSTVQPSRLLKPANPPPRVVSPLAQPVKPTPPTRIYSPFRPLSLPPKVSPKPPSPLNIRSDTSSPKSICWSDDEDEDKMSGFISSPVPDSGSSPNADSPVASPVTLSLKKNHRRGKNLFGAPGAGTFASQRKTENRVRTYDRWTTSPSPTPLVRGYMPSMSHRVPLRRPIIVDGCNVAYQHGKNKRYSAKGLVIIYDYFVNQMGYSDSEIYIVNKPLGKRTPEDLEILERLYDIDVLLNTPKRLAGTRLIASDDDLFMLKVAKLKGGIVVSMDQFRDAYERTEDPEIKEVIEKRILQFVFKADTVIFPDDPMGPGGPTLEEFLRF